MPFYADLEKLSPEKFIHISRRLLNLKNGIEYAGIPPKSFGKLLLATWNIREFDSSSFGKRLEESMYYIAEIIAHFDLVAIQEVRDDLDGLRRLMKLLGKHWQVVFTDVTQGAEGNKERMAYVFDTRKVEFGGLAGELVLPPDRKSKLPQKQWARTPYAVGFKIGWYRFMMVSVHLIYGKSGANAPERIEEIKLLSEFLAERAEDTNAWSNNIILLGDFNIFHPSTKTFEALAEHFRIPDEIMNLPSNAKQSKHFDQIAFRTPYLNELIGRNSDMKAGVFNFFDYVFKADDEYLYQKEMGNAAEKNTNYYCTYFRTHQMSDHLPMWMELPIDRSSQYLEGLASGILEKTGGMNENVQKEDGF